MPTILTCIEAGAGVVIMSHMGRPQGEIDSKLSLIAVGEELASLLEMPIKFSDNCVSTDSIDTSISLKQGEVHLLENLRFNPGEQDNEMEFSSKLARHGQIYINDAFSCSHRKQSSIHNITKYIESGEVRYLNNQPFKHIPYPDSSRLKLIIDDITINDLINDSKEKIFNQQRSAEAILAIIMRMLFLPMAILLYAKFSEISPELKKDLVIQAAMHAHVFTIILTKEYGCDTYSSVRFVIVTTLLSVITIPPAIVFGLWFVGISN